VYFAGQNIDVLRGTGTRNANVVMTHPNHLLIKMPYLQENLTTYTFGKRVKNLITSKEIEVGIE
jgi:hypothetical protein